MSVRVEHVVHAVLSESLRAQEEHYTVMCFERNYVHSSPPSSGAAREPGEATTCVPSVTHELGAARGSSGARSART